MSRYNEWLLYLSLFAIQFVFPPATAGLPWRVRFGPRPGAKAPVPNASDQQLDRVIDSVREEMGGQSVKEWVGGGAAEPQPKPGPPKTPKVLSPKSPLPASQLSEAAEQQALADYYWAQQGVASKKTVAHSSGEVTFSGPGYSKASRDFPQRQAPAGERESGYYVRRYEEASGMKPPAGRDHEVTGDEFATHAEVKNRIHQLDGGMGNATGISQDMCGNCRAWHRAAAVKQQKLIVTSDPNYIRAFNPDGTVDIYTLGGIFVRTVPANVPPSAGIRTGGGGSLVTPTKQCDSILMASSVSEVCLRASGPQAA